MKTEQFKINKTYTGAGEVAGIDFTLLKRTNDLCIFKRSDGWFEVVTLRHTKYRERTINGVFVVTQAKEYVRQGDEWGGKIVKTLERAEEIFKEKEINNKTNKGFIKIK